MRKIGNYTILNTFFIDDQYSYHEVSRKSETEAFTIKSVGEQPSRSDVGGCQCIKEKTCRFIRDRES